MGTSNYQGSATWGIFRDIVRKEGFRGLYVGHSMTMLRSSTGNLSLFGSYELAKDAVCNMFEPDSAFCRPVSGILAGWFAWFVTFPLDAAKTRMQLAGARHATADNMKDLRHLPIHKALMQ